MRKLGQRIRKAGPNSFKDGTFTVLFQGGAGLHPNINAPSILAFATNAEQRQSLEFLYAGQGLGRPFIAPANMPPSLAKTVRDAFDATMEDADYILEIKKLGLEHDPKGGIFVETLIRQLYATPKSVIERVGALIK